MKKTHVSGSGSGPCLSHFADHTALLWSIETGRCLVKYTGHVGSGEHPDVTGSPVRRCTEPFQDSGALSRMGGHMDRQPPCCQVWAPAGTAQCPEQCRAGAVCVLCHVARGAWSWLGAEGCAPDAPPRICPMQAAVCPGSWLPPHGPRVSQCCGQVLVALLQRPLWPLPLEGSTSSRPSVPPTPNPVDRPGGGVCLLLLELVVPTCRPVREASLSSAKVGGGVSVP